MLQILTHFITYHRTQTRRLLSSRQGQVAMILIILSAMALVFFAISLNMGKVTQTKVITLKAAELSASQLGSLMASYGEKLFQEQLGGKQKVCGFSGVFTSFLIILVLIVIIIITVITCGAGAAAGTTAGGLLFTSGGLTIAGALVVSAAIGVVAAAVSMGLQAGYINPKMTSMWNKAMQNLGPTGYFMEQGIQVALSTAVTDQAQIPDLYDYDQDGKYGDLTSPSDATTAPDTISRFGLFNTVRLQRGDTKPPDPALQDFKNAADDLANSDGGNDWGLIDPVSRACSAGKDHPCCETGDSLPALCDACCQPRYVPSGGTAGGEPQKKCVACNDGTEDCRYDDPNLVAPEDLCPQTPGCTEERESAGECSMGDPEPIRLAPECCYDAGAGNPGSCGDPQTCYARSPFVAEVSAGVPQGSNTTDGNYPWIYDPVVENSQNNVLVLQPGSSPPLYLTADGSSEENVSFREDLGLDDEHQQFWVNIGSPIGSPNWQTYPVPSDAYQLYIPNISGTTPEKDQIYTIEDSAHFFIDPPFSATSSDLKQGMFPFLYKMKDWFVNLNDRQFSDSAPPASSDDFSSECHWCDYRPTGTTHFSAAPYNPGCATTMLDYNRYEELELQPLQLPLEPLASPPTDLTTSPEEAVYYSGGWCVDKVNTATGGPQVPDRITSIDKLFFTPTTIQCPLDPSATGWRPGVGKYCDQKYPYSEGCPQNGGYHTCTDQASGGEDTETARRDCECGDTGKDPSQFPEDHLDEIIYGIPEFYSWASQFDGIPVSLLNASAPDWYEDAAGWIEPACPRVVGEQCGCDQVPSDEISKCQKDCKTCPGSFTKYSREGKLQTWKKTIESFLNPIEDWLAFWTDADPITGTPAKGCKTRGTCASFASADAWCVPPETPVSAAELAAPGYDPLPAKRTLEAKTFDINSNGIRGDIDDVLACLAWNADDVAKDLANNDVNVDDPKNPSVGIPAQGNYLKFQGCLNAINDGFLHPPGSGSMKWIRRIWFKKAYGG